MNFSLLFLVSDGRDAVFELGNRVQLPAETLEPLLREFESGGGSGAIVVTLTSRATLARCVAGVRDFAAPAAAHIPAAACLCGAAAARRRRMATAHCARRRALWRRTRSRATRRSSTRRASDFGCGALLNDPAQLREYAQAACVRRQIVCRFCRLAVAAGPPAASADDRRASARVLELCMDAEAAYLFPRERQKRHDEE